MSQPRIISRRSASPRPTKTLGLVRTKGENNQQEDSWSVRAATATVAKHVIHHVHHILQSWQKWGAWTRERRCQASAHRGVLGCERGGMPRVYAFDWWTLRSWGFFFASSALPSSAHTCTHRHAHTQPESLLPALKGLCAPRQVRWAPDKWESHASRVLPAPTGRNPQAPGHTY